MNNNFRDHTTALRDYTTETSMLSLRAAIVFCWKNTRLNDRDGLIGDLPREIIGAVLQYFPLPAMNYKGLLKNQPVALGGTGTRLGAFKDCMFCSVMPDGRLAVGDSDNRRLQVIDPDNKVSPLEVPFRSHTSGVAALDDGRVALAELTGHCVKIIDIKGYEDGNVPIDLDCGKMAFGQRMGCLWDACYDPVTKVVFVADSDGYRVNRFRITGMSCESLTSLQAPLQDKEFTRSVAVDVKRRKLYVAHTSAIEIFDIDTGEYINTFLECGEKHYVEDINGLAVDSDGNVLMATGLRSRSGGHFYVFSEHGDLLYELSPFIDPCGIAIDEANQRIFICERPKDVIYMFQ